MLLNKKFYILIKGGLGNQMSQYAYYLSLKKRLGDKIFPLYSSENYYPIAIELKSVFDKISCLYVRSRSLEFLAKLYSTKKYYYIINPIKYILNKIGFNVIHENYRYDFKELSLDQKGLINLICGGWHCEEYFKDISEELTIQYEFDIEKLNLKTKNISKELMNCNSVSIHVRRKDYELPSSIFGGIADLNYYKNAINTICLNIDNPIFYIFSDDLEWVKKNLQIKANYIDWNLSEESWQDMYLMSICKNNIICNSTFSWWGAWLNKNDKKIVICPNRFINTSNSNGIYPSSWLRILS
jgi:hypothetical protein